MEVSVLMIHLLGDLWADSSLGDYKESCCEHLCMCFCVNTSFHFSRIEFRVLWQPHVYFVKEAVKLLSWEAVPFDVPESVRHSVSLRAPQYWAVSQFFFTTAPFSLVCNGISWGFNLHFSSGWWLLTLLSWAYFPSVCPIEWNVFSCLLFIFRLDLLSSCWLLLILYIS